MCHPTMLYFELFRKGLRALIVRLLSSRLDGLHHMNDLSYLYRLANDRGSDLWVLHGQLLYGAAIEQVHDLPVLLRSCARPAATPNKSVHEECPEAMMWNLEELAVWCYLPQAPVALINEADATSQDRMATRYATTDGVLGQTIHTSPDEEGPTMAFPDFGTLYHIAEGRVEPTSAVPEVGHHARRAPNEAATSPEIATAIEQSVLELSLHILRHDCSLRDVEVRLWLDEEVPMAK